MDLDDRVDAILAEDDPAGFVAALRDDLRDHPDEWEDVDLDPSLDVTSRRLSGMDHAFRDLGEDSPGGPSWRLLGPCLLAAEGYG